MSSIWTTHTHNSFFLSYFCLPDLASEHAFGLIWEKRCIFSIAPFTTDTSQVDINCFCPKIIFATTSSNHKFTKALWVFFNTDIDFKVCLGFTWLCSVTVFWAISVEEGGALSVSLGWDKFLLS